MSTASRIDESLTLFLCKRGCNFLWLLAFVYNNPLHYSLSHVNLYVQNWNLVGVADEVLCPAFSLVPPLLVLFTALSSLELTTPQCVVLHVAQVCSVQALLLFLSPFLQQVPLNHLRFSLTQQVFVLYLTISLHVARNTFHSCDPRGDGGLFSLAQLLGAFGNQFWSKGEGLAVTSTECCLRICCV